jgi:hypothetical protein
MKKIIRCYTVIATILAIVLWSGSYGATQAWSVEQATPLVATNGATNVSPAKATIKGTYRPHELKIDDVYFEYGPSLSYGSRISPVRDCKKYDWDVVCDVYTDITNLTPQQNYHFRLVVKFWSKISNGWQLATGEDRTFGTQYPPSATTGEVTDITSASAVFHGTANPNGNSTDAYFEYNKACYWGCPAPKTAGNNIGSGTGAVTMNVKVTGLESGNKYYYRLCASSNGGKSCGDQKNFFAPSKPIVTTYDATEIGTLGATFNGTVNPGGLYTMYYFEYGESSSYGIKKSQVSAGNGGDPKTVSLPLPNSFTPGKLYHYRIVASNNMGVSYGEDKTFTAQKLIAPSATTGSATNITISTATLNGVVNPHNDLTMWHFEYRKPGGEWKKTDNAGVSVESDWDIKSNIWGLDPDITYSYKLTATNGAGTVTGEEKTFKTSALATATAATGPVKNVTKSSATVTGTINPNGTTTSYWFWYGTSKPYTYHTTGVTGLTGTSDISVSADLISLAPDTTYYYRISTNNIKGAVDGEDKTFKTAAITKAPVVTTSPARDIKTSSATIGGTVNPNGKDTTYYCQYGTTTAYGATAPATPQPAGSGTSSVPVTISLSGLKAGTTYNYRVVAVNSDGTSNGTNMTFTTTSSLIINTPAVRSK